MAHMNSARPSSAPLDPRIPDAELAARVAAGEEGAFRLLMRRHNQTLFRTARAILRDDAEAEDALQDAYLQAFRSIGSFRGESKLSTWLVRVVANVAIARVRKQRRGAEVIPIEGDPDDSYGEDPIMAEPAPTSQPEREAIGAEVRRILERKIDDLPAPFRTVFVLREVEEMSVEETAACLGIPEATVRTRLFRARALLRASLSREMDLAVDGAFSFLGERCDRITEAVMSRWREEAPRGS
jgi:RNA polymerase sigma-70 factor (ECF subfamily)